jgi:hypothetical protein
LVGCVTLVTLSGAPNGATSFASTFTAVADASSLTVALSLTAPGTSSLKFWVAFAPTPFVAVIVKA